MACITRAKVVRLSDPIRVRSDARPAEKLMRVNRRSFCRQSTALLLSSKQMAASLLLGEPKSSTREWRSYAGDPGATRYSSLDQINRSNVRHLKVAWTHRTGDKRDRPQTTIECTPIVVDGVMYVTTARVKVRALEAATGRVIWTYDPFEGAERSTLEGVNRGVTCWEEGKDKTILFVAGSRLMALNAATGRPMADFGEQGSVDLRKGLDRDIPGLYYAVTTPGVIYKNLIILGSTVGEGPRPAAPGHVRAYDVRTGKREWIFHTIPHPGEFGHETWEGDSWKTAGGCNDWGGMSVDEKRGLVFLALGSPSFDFYGGQRLGQNLFGNSVVALNAETGERVWHFQTVHHDLWDYDLPCAPILVTLAHSGRRVDAVAQATKMGLLFVLDRTTGKPLFPVEERRVPASDLPGERTWPTQPFPLNPPPFSRQTFTQDDVTNISPEAHAYVLEEYKKARAGNIYQPPSKQGTIIFPGFHGGALWGGASCNPRSGRLFVNANNVPWILRIVDAKPGAGFPFDHEGYKRFEDEERHPGVKPPWGQLSAIDLNQGEIVWQAPLGEYKVLTARGIPQTGTEMMGGSIATAGGLVFIGATPDEKFRAFDQGDGKVLWQTPLEAGGYATPATYEVNGRQYVVIAAGGGGKLRTRSGDSFVAFSLP